jgi:adenosine kinase
VKGKTLVVGSIAFDLIFSIEPTFKQEIPLVEGKIDNVNMTFVAAKDTQVVYGGTGSNIAYSHALLSKNNVLLFSAVGEDFQDTLGKKLIDMGVIDRTVVYPSETARSYQISDSNFEQMIIWQPNAYSHIGEIDLNESIDDKSILECNNAIFSPGTPQSTLRHILNYRKVNTEGNVIFDPGQMVNHYDKETFTKCCKLSNIIIVNEVELLKVQTAFNITETELIDQYNLTIIVTKGGKGSDIKTKDQEITVMPFEITRDFKEATGAGDAFRGGLLAALSRGKDLTYACKVGSVLGSLSVQEISPQVHQTTWDQVKKIVGSM